MDLEAFKEAYNDCAYPYRNEYGEYDSDDESLDHVTYLFVSRYTDISSLIFIYENLSKIVDYYDHICHESVFFKVFLERRDYAQMKHFIKYFSGDRRVIENLSWQLRIKELLFQLLLPIIDTEFFGRMFVNAIQSLVSLGDRRDLLHQLLQYSEDNFYWKGQLLTDEFTLKQIRMNW